MTGDAGGYDVLTAIDQFDQAGIDRSKVVLGAPAYTRAWGDVAAGDDYGYGETGAARAPVDPLKPATTTTKTSSRAFKTAATPCSGMTRPKRPMPTTPMP